MIHDVTRELEHYGDYADALAPTITLEEITYRRGEIVSRHPDPRRVIPNWAIAVGVAVAAIVLIGGFVWMAGGSSTDMIEVPMPTVPTPTPMSLPELLPLVTIDADQINYPLGNDATNGVAAEGDTLWVATDGGLVRWDLAERRAEENYPTDDLPFREGSSGEVAIAPDGTVWAFTWNQDLAYFDGTSWSEPSGYDQLDVVNPRCVTNEECPDPITAMAIGPDGLLSLAVGDQTLLRFDGVDWSVLPVTSAEYHAGSAWAADMAVDSDGVLWVASWEEMLTFDGGVWTRFTATDGLPSGAIGSVAIAPNGEAWVGATTAFEGDSSGGVGWFDGRSWTLFGEADGLYDNNVTGLTVAPDGTVWTVHGFTGDARADEEHTTGGVSRFDGSSWSTTTIENVGEGFGWGEPDVDGNGTLWITSRWGAIGFDGAEATVLRVPNGTRAALHWVPFTVPSRILPAGDGPFEWRWDPDLGSVVETPGMETLTMGDECYGSGGNQRPSAVVEFMGQEVEFTFGHVSTPNMIVTDHEGTVTDVGNPFGEDTWLCGVAANDTHLLAVGSGVFWSDDGITWNAIEAFEEYVGSEGEWSSNLLWAAAGPEGYMVFSQTGDRERAAWFSADLQSWYEIPIDEPADSYSWGLVGPTGVSVGGEPTIIMFEGAWVGTRRGG